MTWKVIAALGCACTLSLGCGSGEGSDGPSDDGAAEGTEDAADDDGQADDDAAADGTAGDSGGGSDSGAQSTGADEPAGFDLPALEWSYVPVDGAICRNGNPTGVLVNPNPDSDKYFVFLEEGAACFNAFSCGVAFTFDPDEADDRIEKIESTLGASNRESPDNPFAEWNLVFVPYCSGDVYAGNANDVSIGGTTYQFQGFNNVTLIFEALREAIPSPSQMVLAGTSAGGWGAGFNYPKARDMFPETEVILIDDSAAYMANDFIPACWQEHLRDTWNLDSTLPEDCVDCFDNDQGTFIEELIVHILEGYPDFRGGLMATAEDAQMRLMLGFSEEDCGKLDAFFPPDYAADKFTAGLQGLRDEVVASYPGFRVFYDTGNTHGFLSHTTYGQLVEEFDPRFDAVVDGVSVTDWLHDAVGGGEWESVSAF